MNTNGKYPVVFASQEIVDLSGENPDVYPLPVGTPFQLVSDEGCGDFLVRFKTKGPWKYILLNESEITQPIEVTAKQVSYRDKLASGQLVMWQIETEGELFSIYALHEDGEMFPASVACERAVGLYNARHIAPTQLRDLLSAILTTPPKVVKTAPYCLYEQVDPITRALLNI